MKHDRRVGEYTKPWNTPEAGIEGEEILKRKETGKGGKRERKEKMYVTGNGESVSFRHLK